MKNFETLILNGNEQREAGPVYASRSTSRSNIKNVDLRQISHIKSSVIKNTRIVNV